MSCKIDKSQLRASNLADTELDLPEGVPPLISLYLYISGSCNLACRHCWISPTYIKGGNGGRHVRVDHVRKTIREALPLGLQTVKLTGGEPMLHPQFREVVSVADSESLEIHIETNGTLINQELAVFLKHKENVTFISVSVDGTDAKTHDSLRGVSGSFDQAISGIRNLVEQGFQPQLICTLHRGNVSLVGKVIQFAEDLGCGSVKFNHVQQVGRGKQFAHEQGLEIPDVIDAYRRVEMDRVEQSKIPIHFDIPFAFYTIRKLLDDNLGRCTVMNILGLLAGGELSLCGIGVTVPELVYGHIEKDSLRNIWCNSPGLIQLREKVPVSLEGVCSKCMHRDLCQGACVAHNYHIAGKLNAPYQFCHIADELGLFPDSRKKDFIR